MEDLHALPSSVNSSRASSRQSSSPDLTESHLYIRDFVRETRQRLNFSSIQLTIHDDRQVSELSDGVTILVPLSCSALTALASMTRQLDTITTQTGTIQSIVATLPTSSALDSRLSPIHAALRDLSQRVSAAPPTTAPAPTRAPVPPADVTTRPTPPPAQPKAKTPITPPTKVSPSAFDPEIARYDPDTRALSGDPRAYAGKFPESGEANPFHKGKYPDPTTFISGYLAHDYSKPQPSYAQAASKGASKGKKNKSSLTATKVASANSPVPATQPPRSLPTADRRFYAPHSSPSEHPQAPLIAATLPDIAARVLRDANCILPLAVTTKLNDRGSATLLVTDPATPAAAFAPYCDALSSQLNKSFPVGESPWLPFRLAPNEAQLAIHSVPLAFLPEDPSNSSHASRSLSLTPKTCASSPADTSIPTQNPGRARLPPPSSSPSTLETCLQWAPRFDSSPVHARSNAPTLPIGTRSVRTAGARAMSPLGAPQPTPFAPFAPSTTPVPCTDVPTPLALEVATLRLFLAVALPRRPAVSTVGRIIPARIGIAKAGHYRPLSGVQPLPLRAFPAANWRRDGHGS